MGDTLTLFETSEPQSEPLVDKATLELLQIAPYARYALALVLYHLGWSGTENLTEAELRKGLIYAIENGLEHFRMRTDDDPSLTRNLAFDPIPLSTLKSKPTWIQSSGLASQGIYIYPTVITTDGDAKGTFENAVAVVKALREGEAAGSARKYSRSFAPTTAKINNGTASQSEPKGTLYEAACAVITTLAPLKPAAWVERNTAIIPDIPLEEMILFIEFFDKMQISGIRKDLMLAQLPKQEPTKETKAVSAKAKKPKEPPRPKSDYRRPRLHNGNYPYAPRDSSAFGAVGLLAAIGRWGVANNQVKRAKRVLDALAKAPLYIISYDKISQVRFDSHIVGLSIESHLSEMLDALWYDTQLYADLDSPRIKHDTPAYQLFYLQTSRFLQSFSPPAFRDFLAARAEYPAILEPLFRQYFQDNPQSKMNIPKDVVHSAGILGQWLNRTAYFVADSEFEKGASDRIAKVRKAKAKILVEFESSAMSAKSSHDLLYRISTRAGRLLQDDAPAEAKRFFDAVNSEEITQEQAVHLLIAYMRLRAPKKETGEPTVVEEFVPSATSETTDAELED